MWGWTRERVALTALASQPVFSDYRSFRRRESVIAAAPMVKSARVEGSGTVLGGVASQIRTTPIPSALCAK